jgi:hypothetical protein
VASQCRLASWQRYLSTLSVCLLEHQGNRNPFIDNPDWVGCLFGAQCASGCAVVRVDNSRLWINEIHYDNNGVDAGEFVEVAGRAGMVLDGWW